MFVVPIRDIDSRSTSFFKRDPNIRGGILLLNAGYEVEDHLSEEAAVTAIRLKIGDLYGCSKWSFIVRSLLLFKAYSEWVMAEMANFDSHSVI